MGPPREHGGMRIRNWLEANATDVAMGPPREHGGMALSAEIPRAIAPSQWGRRVNTAEWLSLQARAHAGDLVAMGPPREHGGMQNPAGRVHKHPVRSQWGRRVNTAEWSYSPRANSRSAGRNGAAA